MPQLWAYGRPFKNQTHHFTLTPPSLSFTPHLLVPSHSDISIYELFTGRTVSKLKGHYSSVTCIDVNTNDIEVYTGSTDNTVLIWTPLNNEVSILCIGAWVLAQGANKMRGC